MQRRYANLLFILIYVAAQTVQIIPLMIYNQQNLTPQELLNKSIPYTIGGFIVASILVFIINRYIKNETALERKPKELWHYTLIWVICGFFGALISQALLNMVNVYILNQPIESQNTAQILEVAKLNPWFILLVAVAGPILEEFVFRKVIFGELYQLIRLPRFAAFLIATLISGLIFAIAHFDFDHLIIYMGMSFVFSGLYVSTRRIITPILAHMAMNGFVVAMNVLFAEDIEKASKTFNTIIIPIKMVLGW